MQNILIVTEKNSLLVRSAMEHFKELEYNVVVEDLDVQKISKLKDSFEALILYMESDVLRRRVSAPDIFGAGPLD